jgi:hypothetical protein
MAQWFIQSAADVLGPFTPGELLEKVRRGLVTPQTQLRKDDSAWFPAAEIGGLFEAATKPTIRFVCPGCGGTIKQPPCACPHCSREVEVARREVIQNRIQPSANNSQTSGGPGASMQGWLNRMKRRGSS